MDFNRLLEKTVEDFLVYGKENAVEEIIKVVFETVMSMERNEFLSLSDGNNKANGYYERMARGITNFFRIRVPRDRLGVFHPVFLDKIKNEQSQLENLAFSLYVKGLSTRDISDVLDENFGRRYSPSFVSKLTSEFKEIRESWLNRPLDKEYLFVFVDAIHIPVRRDSVQSEAFYVIMGLNKDLRREILGVYNFPTENTAGWESAFEDIKRRGFEKCVMFISDGFKGIKKAVKKEFPQQKLQLCLVHKLSNLKKHIRANAFREFREDFNHVFRKEDSSYTVEDAKKAFKLFVDKWRVHYKSLPNHFQKEDMDNYFEYLNLPSPIQRMVYSTNWIERLNKEIRKTTHVRNSFPSPDSAMNLIAAFLIDKQEKKFTYPITSFLCVKEELENMLR